MVRFDHNGNGTTVCDEVENFVDSRYISASQALWRIDGFAIHGKAPAVEKLPCHLGQQQMVYFRSNDQVHEALYQPENKRTAFFKTNQCDETARSIRYPDFPQYFTWNAKKWNRCNYGTECDTGLRRYKTVGIIPVIGSTEHQTELYSSAAFSAPSTKWRTGPPRAACSSQKWTSRTQSGNTQ